MEWLVIIIIGAVLFWWIFVREGGLSFWKLAAKHPEEAYRFFQNEDCWFVNDIPESIDRKDILGPFRLAVPTLGQSIKIYGLADQIEESERKFRNMIE